jgi:hypothetical protein
MKLPKRQKDATYYSHKTAPLFDMLVIVGMVFNALMAVFVVLYWLDLV